MLPESTLRRIVGAIYSQPELYGVVVRFDGLDQKRILSEGVPQAANYQCVIIIIEETRTGGTQVLSETAPPTPATGLAATNGSRLKLEMTGAGISCTLAVVSGLGVVAGAAAEAPSFGGSTVLVVLAWTGFTTSGIQCLNGIARSTVAWHNPGADTLEQWDSNDVYRVASQIVDWVGVASSVAALPYAARNIFLVLERRGGLVSAEQLTRLSRTQRASAVERSLQQATRTAEGREAVETALREAGLSERQATQVMERGANTGRRARLVAKAISDDTARRLSRSVRDVLGGAGGLAANALPASLVGSASGVVNGILIHIISHSSQ